MASAAGAQDRKSDWLWVRSPLEDIKYLFFSFLRSGIETKRGVKFLHSTHNSYRVQRKGFSLLLEYTRFLLPTLPGIRRESKKIFFLFFIMNLMCFAKYSINHIYIGKCTQFWNRNFRKSNNRYILLNKKKI